MGRAFKALLLVILLPFNLCAYAVVEGFHFVKVIKGKPVLTVKGNSAVVKKGVIIIKGASISYEKGYVIGAKEAFFELGKDHFVFKRSILKGKKGVVLAGSSMRYDGRSFISTRPKVSLKDGSSHINISSKLSKFFLSGRKRVLLFYRRGNLSSDRFAVKGDFIKIIMFGNRVSLVSVEKGVKLTVGGKRASCDTLLWIPRQDKLVLKGDVVAMDGGNVFKGEELFYSFKTGGFYSYGGEGRVMFKIGGEK